MKNLFDLVAKISLDSSGYEQGLKAAEKQTDVFSKVLQANLVAKGIEKLIGGLANASKKMFDFAKSAISAGKEFDAAMSQVAATMGVTVGEIGELREFAQKMGAQTAFSANEAAQALNYMALAGYDAEKSMKTLPAVLNLAAAGNMDLARASDMVTDAESALGLTSKQSAAMVDQMAKTASKSNTSVSQLGDAMLTIGGTAKFMAGGTDRLQTVLGLLADNGIKGAEAGTHLRNMLLKLSSPTKEGAKIMKRLGVAIFDADGSMRDMQDITLELNSAMSKLTEQEKVQALSEIFNARDLSAVNALLGTSKKRWDELGAAISDAKGSAEAMAETQLDNLNGDITIMQSALEGVKIQFSDGITPSIRKVVQLITRVLSQPKTQKFLRDVGEGLGKLIKRITEITSNVILPRLASLFENGAKKLKIFGGVAVGLIGTIKTVSSVMGLLAGTLSPAGLLLKGIGLLAGAFIASDLAMDDYIENMRYLSERERDAVNAMNDLSAAQKDAAQAYNDSIGPIVDEKNQLNDLWKELQSIVTADGKVKEGHEERADMILGKLNNALGTEYRLNGDLIEQYDTMKTQIGDLIEKRAAEALLAANEEAYVQAVKNREQAILDAGEAYRRMTTYKDEYNKKDAEANVLYEKWKDAHAKGNEKEARSLIVLTAEARNAANDAKLSYEKWEETYNEASATSDNLLATIDRNKKAEMLIYEGNYKEAQDLLTKDYDNSLEIQRKKATNNLQELVEYRGMLENKRAAILEYQRKLIAGQEGYNKETLQEMRKAFNAEIQEAQNAGINVGVGLAIGLSKSKAKVIAEAGALIRGAIHQMKAVAQIASPSKQGRRIGSNIGNSVGLGLDDSYDDVIESSDNLIGGVLDNLERTPDSKTVTIGASDNGSGFGAILSVLREIRDRMGFDLVLDDGVVAGRIDKLLGQTALRKARGNA